MARFALNIYGENDEIIKTYETDHVRWGVFTKAIKASENDNSFDAISEIVKMIFVGLTDEEIAKADYNDVIANFVQLTNQAAKISGDGQKN